MNLYSPAWTRMLRANVRRQVFASPELKREYRRAQNRFWRNRALPPWVYRLIPAAWAALYAFAWRTFPKAEDALAAMIVVWGTLYLLHRVSLFQAQFSGGANPDAAVFRFCPVTDKFVFRFRWESLWRPALFWLALDFLAGYAALAYIIYGADVSWLGWLGIGAGAMLLAGSVFAASALIFWQFPRFPAGAILGFLCLGGLGLFFAGKFAPGLSWELFGKVYPWFRQATPAGWMDHARTAWLVDRQPAQAAFWLLATLLAAVSLPFSYRGLRGRFQFWPSDAEDSPRIMADDDDAIAAAEAGAAGVPEGEVPEFIEWESGRRVSEVRDEIEEAGLTQAAFGGAAERNWAYAGWIERLALRCGLRSERQRMIARIMCGGLGAPRWTAAWRQTAYVLAAGAAGALLTILLRNGPFGADGAMIGWGMVAVYVCAAVAAMRALPVFGGNWAVFITLPLAGRITQFHSLYPISSKEIRAVGLRLNAARILAAAPLFIAYAALTHWLLFHTAATTAAAVCAKMLWAVLASQPFWLTSKLSLGTNSTQGIGWASAAIVLGLFFYVATCIGAAALMFFPSAILQILGAVWLPMVSLLFSGAYGRANNRGAFDAVTLPRPR